jgi:photosystem II stability/assembly factor-like uncharacterized protein
MISRSTLLMVALVAALGAAVARGTLLQAAPSAQVIRSYWFFEARGHSMPRGVVEYVERRTSPTQATFSHHLLLRDGHGRWRDATPRDASAIDDVFFVDSRRGWLITSDCAAGTGALYRTVDGGRSWKRLSSHWSHGCAGGSGFRLSFLDKHHGWLVSPAPTAPGSAVYRTADGGRTWTSMALDFPGPLVDRVAFRTLRAGWGTWWSFIHPRPGSLYRSSDSGKHWAPEISLPAGKHYSLPVFFGRRGIVMAARPERASFYATRDGGLHWELISMLGLGHLRFTDLKVSSARNWWVFGMRGSTPVVFVTTDSGRTWSPRTVPATGVAVRLVAGPEGHAWLATYAERKSSSLFSTSDAGVTWHRFVPSP